MPKAIRYIGVKPRKEDNVAGTGLVWTPGEVHVVTSEVGSKLLRHPDVWEETEIEQGLEVQPVGTAKKEDKPQKKEDDPRPSLVNFSAMSLPQLREHAKAHFNETLPRNFDKAKALDRVLRLDQIARNRAS